MYAQSVIDRAQAKLEAAYHRAFPTGLIRYPVATCATMTGRLAGIWDPTTKQPTRRLTPEEDAFVAGERLLCKIDFRYWAERYCNPPEAPIWMGDLSFKPLGEVKVGDTVIGWERPTGRLRETLVRTRVLAIARRCAPLVRVTFESGRVLRCTPDHLWSNGDGAGRVGGSSWRDKSGNVRRYHYPWIAAKVGRTLSFVADPEAGTPSGYDEGWLGGMYDGEGGASVIAQHVGVNPGIHARIGETCARLGISATPLKNGRGYNLNGGRAAFLRFLLRCRPTKRKWLERRILSTAFRTADRIVAVDPVGVGEVVSLQTETGNYVAWGYASKNCFIQAAGQGLQRLTPLWETQEIALSEFARLQESRLASGHPDGLLVNVLKARQGGISTLGAALVTHRAVTQTYVKALLASDVPDNSGSEGLFGMYERLVANLPWWLAPSEKFHQKNQHIVFDSGSGIFVESGKSMKGGLQDKGGQKGQLGRSKTYSVVHLTELSTWEYPEQIDDSLMPAVPRTPRTLGIKESTAKGRHNWHHEDWLLGQRGRGRWTNVFIPWYAEETKYWLPAPVDWTPSADTLAEARKAESAGPIYLHRPVTLSRNQLYWWEETRAAYAEKGQLARFLEEFASDPESCFQASGRSIFTLDQLQYLRRLAHPMIDCWAIEPARDLAGLAAAERKDLELARNARAAAEAKARAEHPVHATLEREAR